MNKFVDIEFACHVAYLAVADKFSVYPKIEAGIDTFKIEEKVTAEVIFVNLKVTDINSARVVVRDIRRIARVRVIRIRVVRHVIALIKCHLPVHRNSYFVIIAVDFIICGVKAVLNVNYRVVESEIPLSVEKLEIF